MRAAMLRPWAHRKAGAGTALPGLGGSQTKRLAHHQMSQIIIVFSMLGGLE